MAHKYTEEQKAFILNNYKGISTLELTKRFNDRFGTEIKGEQLRAYKKNYKLSSGYDARFKKGQPSPWKGRKMPAEVYEKAKGTMFKKGNIPHNTLPIGSEVKNADGYWMVKVNDDPKAYRWENWKFKHRMIWEAAHGAIPESHVIIFLDGDRNNFELDNLECISTKESLMANRKELRFDDKEFTRSGIAIAKVLSKIAELKNE